MRILLDHLAESDSIFEFSVEYVENLRKAYKSANSGARSQPGIGRAAEFDDEDMMEGLH